MPTQISVLHFAASRDKPVLYKRSILVVFLPNGIMHANAGVLSYTEKVAVNQHCLSLHGLQSGSNEGGKKEAEDGEKAGSTPSVAFPYQVRKQH